MTKNAKKSDVTAGAKSSKFAYILTIIPADIVDWPALLTLWQAATAGKLASQVPLLTGSSSDDFKTIECKGNTVVPVVNAGEAPTDGKAEISGTVEGVNDKTLEWAYSAQGTENVVIAERCSDGTKFIFANPCTGGMVFQYQSIGAQDGGVAGISFKFIGEDCPVPMLVYAPA